MIEVMIHERDLDSPVQHQSRLEVFRNVIDDCFPSNYPLELMPKTGNVGPSVAKFIPDYNLIIMYEISFKRKQVDGKHLKEKISLITREKVAAIIEQLEDNKKYWNSYLLKEE
ncbi:hypothetical protein HN865_00735 [Candidatus Woesearchaeota archaeon]|jgi:hypothetical protein|nr:hypothetical protein [Candidatus Woesearchaeota archaeon]MBT7237365.1 hypothetical protein [Candidatus Woesearchaeota archaeon]